MYKQVFVLDFRVILHLNITILAYFSIEGCLKKSKIKGVKKSKYSRDVAYCISTKNKDFRFFTTTKKVAFLTIP